jgi:hypothetical protein
MNWKSATLGQLYEIAYHDKGCDPRHKLAAKEELRCRYEASRAKIKYRAQGRNHG